MREKTSKAIYVILHNIRSAHNVGSIFRTADAAGVAKIYLTGYTPAPIDRFGRKRGDIAKAALGAEESVPWEQYKEIQALLEKIKSDNVEIVGVEQDKGAVDYRMFKQKEATVFIFGNEVQGLLRNILDQCDIILEIPMYGNKESLNVSVTAGIILFNTI